MLPKTEGGLRPAAIFRDPSPAALAFTTQTILNPTKEKILKKMAIKSTPQQQQLRLVRGYLRRAGYVNEQTLLKLGRMVRNWARDKPGEYVGHIGEFSVRVAKRTGIRLEDGKGERLGAAEAGNFQYLSSSDEFESLSKKISRHLSRKKKNESPPVAERPTFAVMEDGLGINRRRMYREHERASEEM